MIYFDIDGVLRDLCTPVFGYEPVVWDAKIKSSDLIGTINENLSILMHAPTFEYINVAKDIQFSISILSAQPPTWQPYTNIWLSIYLPYVENIVYVDHAPDKLTYLNPGDILVEDYPRFNDYSKVVLVDRLYNNHVDSNRVHNSTELYSFLQSYI